MLFDPLIEGECGLVIHREVPVPLSVVDDSRVIDLGDGFIHFLKSLKHEGYLCEVAITLINLDFLEHLLPSGDVWLRHLEQLQPECFVEHFLRQSLVHPVEGALS